MNTSDVIVVGGGHAGIEAAHAAARMGSSTTLITLDQTKIGLMPCNPSIGGVGKGHIVYEISALGGVMPKLCTKTYLQARMLNTSKGPAVQGLRLQIDKFAYNQASREFLSVVDNLTIVSGAVTDVILDDSGSVCGVKVNDKTIYYSKIVILTTGTFLNGRIHVGTKNHEGGRQGEKSVTALSRFLQRAGLKMERLKTGTPPRLLRSSINFSRITYQDSDELAYLFEFYPHKVHNTHACYITHTNEKTHQIIRDNLDKSAMYAGSIKGKGPRYCPSIEDKIARFPEKTSHHVFVEPEGANSDEVYPSGISTSLPLEVQQEYIQSIVGFEKATITRPGYAVEYDFVLPNQLHATLEVKIIDGLFLAGQINGTTGYEEAAGQGIVAGINAHLKHTGQTPFILDRTTSYIGVMIDDLVTLGVDEPYRMFTSRAEYRLQLRQDNAFLRLTEQAFRLGLIDFTLYDDFKREKESVESTLHELTSTHPHNKLLTMLGTSQADKTLVQEYSDTTLSPRAVDIICAEIQYAPYLKRQQQEIKKMQQYNNLILPENLDYTTVEGLSKELQEKLAKYKPKTIEKAALIPGMTPAALSLLIFTLRNKKFQIEMCN